MTTTANTNTANSTQVNYAPPLFGVAGDEILSTIYPPPVWIVPDLIPSGLTILAGRPKIGKSWLTLQIAQATSAGGMLFDKPVQQGRVLYIALEDNESRLQERMKQQDWTKKTAKNTTFFTASIFRTFVGALHKTGAQYLQSIIVNEGYKLCVIDTLHRSFIGLRDINDSQEVTAALAPLQEMAISNDIGLLFVDHQAKSKLTNPNPIDDIFGSTAKAAVLDTAMGIYKNPQSKVLRLLATGRNIQEIDVTLKFDVLTGCWQSEGNTDQYVNNLLESEIIDVLIDLGAAPLADIAKAVGKDRSNTNKRLIKLINRGIVETIQHPITKKTIAYKYIGTP